MTTATKQGHTPGPWHVEDAPDSGLIFIRSHPAEVSLANIRKGQDHPNEANARLIAAAPELLEALKAIEGRITKAANAFYVSGKRSDLQAAFDGWKVDAQQARAAIARATGQGGGE